MQLLILIGRRVVIILILGGLAFLAYYSVLLARADVSRAENNLGSLRNAVRLVPGNAAYNALLAEHLESAGANPDTELEIATHLSPSESRYWIRLGFRAELEQRYDDSERYLIEAYRVDRGFDPRWALMNYYFRRGNLPAFWKSATEALNMSYGNLDPIFRLCMALSDDPSVTRRILPPRRKILISFLSYLTRHEYAEPAAPIAEEVALGAESEDVPLLVDYCAREMDHGASSLLVWNAMCSRHVLSFPELSPEHGQIVTNGDFAATPLQQAFDWKFGAEAGTQVAQIEMAHGLSVDLSGKQSDYARLLEQRIPLSPGFQYVINYDYRLVGPPSDSGLHWVVQGDDRAGSHDPLAISAVLSAQDWGSGSIAFSAGQRDTAKLILEYRRAVATLRWKGQLRIRRVTSALAHSVTEK